MLKIFTAIKKFLLKETVFTAALVLAIASAFIVKPSADYLGYMNWHVLGLLLSMMLVMEGYKTAGLFSKIGERLMSRSMSLRRMSLILTLLCFFSSMLITNDVALITFVPFTIFILREAGKTGFLIPIITLQTVAANLGSMLTPIGNPQNLYLYTLSGLSVADFCRITLPYCTASLIILVICTLLLPRAERLMPTGFHSPRISHQKTLTSVYSVLFTICLLTVLRLVPWWASLGLTAATIFIVNRKIFISIDYFLLLTFAAFFILIGNIQHIEPVRELLEALVGGNEVLVGAGASQVISNVPAAILLSGFTSDIESLVIGVSLGGLGTLIASMASLISYKLFAHEFNDLKGRYIVYFSIFNFIFLAVLLGLHYLIAG